MKVSTGPLPTLNFPTRCAGAFLLGKPPSPALTSARSSAIPALGCSSPTLTAAARMVVPMQARGGERAAVRAVLSRTGPYSSRAKSASFCLAGWQDRRQAQTQMALPASVFAPAMALEPFLRHLSAPHPSCSWLKP